MAQETVVITITGSSKTAVAAAEKASAAVSGVGAASTKAAAQASVAGQKFQAAGKKMSSAGTTLSRNLSLPLLGIGAISGKLAVDFEKSMRNVNSIAQLPEAQFRKLNKAVLAMAGPTAQAPKTLAEGLYDLVSSGFDAKESLKILNASARAATAGLTTTEVSTKAVAAVLNAYHRPAADAKQISDDLFQTVNLGVVSFDELASTIGYVLPAAATMGINLKEVGASISTLTKQGQSGANAVTNINAAVTAFIKPSKDMGSLLKELGYETSEQLIKQKGFQGALELVTKAVKGNKEEIGELFPNVRAMRAVFNLTGKGAKMAGEDLRGFAGDAGATNKVLKEQQKSLSFQWNQLKAEMSKLAIELGNKLIPVLKDVGTEIGGLVKGFTDLPEGVQTTIIKLGALGIALGPVLRLTGAVASGIGAMVSATKAFAATDLAAGLLQGLKGDTAILQILGQGWASKLATGLKVGLPVAIAGAGLANIVSSAVKGDTEDAAFKTGGAIGGAIIGGIAGSFVGSPVLGAMAGGGIGSFLGDMFGDLFDSEKELTPMQKRLQSTAKMVTGALKGQREAAKGLAAAQDRLNESNQRHKRSTEAVKTAQQGYRAALRKFGPDSLPALQAALRLARAQREEKEAAEGAKRAHKAQGIALELYEQRTTRAVAAENRRIPVLRQTVAGLTRKWRNEKDNVQLSGRLEKKVKELNDAESNRSRIIERSAQVASPKFARSLQRMGASVSKFVTEAGKIRGVVEGLPKNVKTPLEKTQSMFEGNSGLMKAIRRFRGETKTELQIKAARSTRIFSEQGAGSFRSLAERVYESDKNIGDNTTGMLEAFNAGKIPKFSLTMIGKGGGKQGLATGGFVDAPSRRDSVHAMLGKDEAVLNVHQQPEVQKALAYGKAAGVTASGSLNELFSRKKRMNYLAGGGKADGGQINLPKPVIEGPEPLQSVGKNATLPVWKAAVKYLREHLLPPRVLAMYEEGRRIAAMHTPYVYGGGHGALGVVGRGMDCSGYVSAILGAGKFISHPESVQQGSGLYTLGEAGDGKFFTWGVRGTSGKSAHTMISVMGPDHKMHFFESGSGHGAAEVGGWSGSFEHRRMPGFAKGGQVKLPAIPEVEKRAPVKAREVIAKHGASAFDPRSPNFVGWGFAGGGFGRDAIRALASGGFPGEGLVLKGRVSYFNGPASTTASGLPVTTPGLALNLHPGTHSGWDNSTTRKWMEMAGNGNPAMGLTKIAGKSATLPVIDLGPHEETGRAIDVTEAGAKKMGLDPSSFPTDSIGTVEITGHGSAGGGLTEGQQKQAEAKRRKAEREARLKQLRQAVGSAKTLPGKRGALWKLITFWSRVGLFDKDEKGRFLEGVRKAASSINPLGAIPILSNLAEYLREHGEVSGRDLGDKSLEDEVERTRKKGTKVGDRRRKIKLRKIQGRGLAVKRRELLAAMEKEITGYDERIDLRGREATLESGPGGSEYTDTETSGLLGLNRELLGKLEGRGTLIKATIGQLQERIAAVTEEIKKARPPKSKTHWKLSALVANREEARRLIGEDLVPALEDNQGVTGEGGRLADVRFAIAELGAPATSTNESEAATQRAELQADLERQRIRGAEVSAANLATFSELIRELKGQLPYVGAFATGGVVPGPMGRPALATVHGGETILRTDQGGGRPIDLYLSADLEGLLSLTTSRAVSATDRQLGRKMRRLRISPGV